MSLADDSYDVVVLSIPNGYLVLTPRTNIPIDKPIVISNQTFYANVLLEYWILNIGTIK